MISTHILIKMGIFPRYCRVKNKKYLKPPPSYKGAFSKGKDRLSKSYFSRGHSVASNGVFFLGPRLLSVFGWELFFKMCLVFNFLKRWESMFSTNIYICICIHTYIYMQKNNNQDSSPTWIIHRFLTKKTRLPRLQCQMISSEAALFKHNLQAEQGTGWNWIMSSGLMTGLDRIG